jgi:ParB family chromosome partitioning protein
MYMTRRLGLGQGLPALLGEKANREEVASIRLEPKDNNKNIDEVSIDLLCSSPYQPRRHFEPNALAELTESIRLQGILQPLVVRPSKTPSMYEIIAGERRWKAAREAGLLTVPVRVHDVDDKTAMAIAIIENIQRQDLAPMDEAIALQNILTEHDIGHGDLAKLLSKSRITISNTLRLLNLEIQVQTLLNEKKLEVGHAKVLLALTGEKQNQAADIVVQQNLSVRATEQLVKRLQQEPSSTVSFTLDPNIEQLKYELSAFLRTSLDIKHTKSGNGKIEIKYKNIQDLKALLQKIKSSFS